MFFPTTITTLEEYIAFIERQLGAEVLSDDYNSGIELTLENFKDIISLSMKEFYRYFQTESLRTKIYVIETVAGKDEYAMDDLLIYKRNPKFGEKNLVPVQPDIFQVLDITPVNIGLSYMAMGGTGELNYEHLFYFNGNAGSGMMGMEKVQMALDSMRNADYIKKLFQRKYYASFDRESNILKINPTPKIDGFTAISVAEYKQFEDLINNDIFWRLTIANAKKQWTSNFMKFDDINIDGGGKSNFKDIRAEGKEEYKEVRQEMEDMRAPLMFFVD